MKQTSEEDEFIDKEANTPEKASAENESVNNNDETLVQSAADPFLNREEIEVDSSNVPKDSPLQTHCMIEPPTNQESEATKPVSRNPFAKKGSGVDAGDKTGRSKFALFKFLRNSSLHQRSTVVRSRYGNSFLMHNSP